MHTFNVNSCTIPLVSSVLSLPHISSFQLAICPLVSTNCVLKKGNYCGTSVHQINFTVCNRLLVAVSSSLGRYDSVLINRLRIGHTGLTNSSLLKGESQPVCEACHSPLTVKHILVDCTHYSAARHRYFGVDTFKDVFENVASRSIIAYVKDINFYNRI